VNLRERSTRLREYELPEWWLTKTAILGHAQAPTTDLRRDTRPRSIERTSSNRISPVWNVATPMTSAHVGGSGHRMVPEANATCRKAQGNHNLVDRVPAHAERRLTGTSQTTQRPRAGMQIMGKVRCKDNPLQTDL
jgi:hypothetical protein